MRLFTRTPALHQRIAKRFHRVADNHSCKVEKKSPSIQHILSTYDSSKGPLTWYSCGPTIYDHAHIGHARTYVCTDIIRRILEDYFRVNVRFAMGITDIDDKIIKKGIEKGFKTWDEYRPMLQQLEDEFFSDMDALHVRRADVVLRVTDHLDDIFGFINKLQDLGFAYPTPLGVYFDVEKLGGSYGKLCTIPPSNIEEQEGSESFDHVEATKSESVDNKKVSSGSSSSVSSATSSGTLVIGKRHWRDFALWKVHKPGEPAWDSPWGAGRPGWHIECSAMTHAYFGSRLDIHSGGVDLKFPHHTNEIAQSEAHHCCPEGTDWVGTWLHTGHLYIEGRKMSKSLKNFVTIREYLADGYGSNSPATDFRLFCLLHKYSSNVHFSVNQIREASAYRNRLVQFLSLCHTLETCARDATMLRTDQVKGGGKTRSRLRPTTESRHLQSKFDLCHAEIRERLSDDFDTPGALRALSELMTHASSYAALLVTSQGSQQIHPIEPLLHTRDSILRLLDILGVNRSGLGIDAGLTSSSSLDQQSPHPSQATSITLTQSLDTFTQFRSQIRSQCLEELKKLKASKKVCKSAEENTSLSTSVSATECYELHLKSILALCDQMRDDKLLKMGIKIDDLNNTLSRWTLLCSNSTKDKDTTN